MVVKLCSITPGCNAPRARRPDGPRVLVQHRSAGVQEVEPEGRNRRSARNGKFKTEDPDDI